MNMTSCKTVLKVQRKPNVSVSMRSIKTGMTFLTENNKEAIVPVVVKHVFLYCIFIPKAREFPT